MFRRLGIRDAINLRALGEDRHGRFRAPHLEFRMDWNARMPKAVLQRQNLVRLRLLPLLGNTQMTGHGSLRAV